MGDDEHAHMRTLRASSIIGARGRRRVISARSPRRRRRCRGRRHGRRRRGLRRGLRRRRRDELRALSRSIARCDVRRKKAVCVCWRRSGCTQSCCEIVGLSPAPARLAYRSLAYDTHSFPSTADCRRFSTTRGGNQAAWCRSPTQNAAVRRTSRVIEAPACRRRHATRRLKARRRLRCRHFVLLASIFESRCQRKLL